MSASIGIELLPEWAPSLDPTHARFDVLLKAPHGVPPIDLGALRVELRDSGGRLADIVAPQLEAKPRPLAGPGWRVIVGRHIVLADRVVYAEAVLGPARSRRVGRGESRRPLTLMPIRDVAGVPHEPNLWWRFYNTTGGAVDMPTLIDSTELWVDGIPTRPIATYNGPSTLAPNRAVSGLWSLDDLGIATPGPHRAVLVMLNERTEPVTIPLI